MAKMNLSLAAAFLPRGYKMKPDKHPRDFVLNDELWPADDQWPSYFPGKTVWLFMDEYHATLPGDETYSRIIVSSGNGEGWIFSRPLVQKITVEHVLQLIKMPICQYQLAQLGFKPWREHDS